MKEKVMKKILGYLFVFMFLFIPITIKSEGFDFEFGDELKRDEDVNGSSVLLGNEVITNNNVDGINVLISNSVEHNGLSEYAVMVGNDIVAKGTIEKDGLILGNYVKLNSFTANRDLFLLGGTSIEFDNVVVNRDLKVWGSSIYLKNTVIEGDITIYATNIEIGSNVTINGKLSYNEDALIKINEDASIASTEVMDAMNQSLSIKDQIYNFMVSYASVLLIFVALAFVVPKLFGKINSKVKEFNLSNIFVLFGFGLLLLVFLPIVLVLLMGIPVINSLAILLLLAYIILVCLSKIIFGYFVGNIIWNKFIKKENNVLLIGLLGISIVSILEILPVFGGFIALLNVILGMGLIFQLFRKD